MPVKIGEYVKIKWSISDISSFLAWATYSIIRTGYTSVCEYLYLGMYPYSYLFIFPLPLNISICYDKLKHTDQLFQMFSPLTFRLISVFLSWFINLFCAVNPFLDVKQKVNCLNTFIHFLAHVYAFCTLLTF